jgi:hypothetical protein
VAAVALASNPLPRKLRVGLFADSALQPRWVAEAFARVAASDFAEVTLIATACGAAPPAPWLWTLYSRLDRRVFGAAADPGEPLPLAQYVPHQRLKKIRRAGLEPQAFRGFDLDVAFALGEIDDTRLDGIARYGVWRFCVDGTSEVVAGEPLSGSALLVRPAAGAAPRVACQSWSRTYPLSVARNRDQLLAKTAEFACRALREAHRSGPGWIERCKPLAWAEAGKRSPALSPILRKIMARGLEKALHVEQWFLAFRWNGGGAGAIEDIAPDLEGFTRILPPRDRYWADPFALEKDGRHYVFFEELPFGAGKAHISMIEVRRDGAYSAPVRVLERDYHLSYPFLVEHEGRLYMIPETAQNRTVEAYRCVEFPLRWRLERVLLDGVRLVDATFHQAADRWWMFANAAAGSSRVFDDELHLFHAERLLGEWQPHRRNPVKSDARCARPAGALYRENGSPHSALLRPAQICVPLYGAGISINRVLRLTPQEYAEQPVARISPAGARSLLGVHTLSRAGELTVVDAFARRRRFA